MTDLIERLRALKTLDVHWERLATEAAAEIGRLQSLVLGLRERCRIQDKLISDNADLHDEIERLRQQVVYAVKNNSEQWAEIERLRAENEGLQAALERLAYDSHGYADDKSGVWHMAKIAREALKDD